MPTDKSKSIAAKISGSKPNEFHYVKEVMGEG
jgi:hypothetical protein